LQSITLCMSTAATTSLVFMHVIMMQKNTKTMNTGYYCWVQFIIKLSSFLHFLAQFFHPTRCPTQDHTGNHVKDQAKNYAQEPSFFLSNNILLLLQLIPQLCELHNLL
jgi:hypothetical protein